MKRGDVVLVVAQGDLGKPRPAIVVQSDELPDRTTTVLICPMTSEVETVARLRPIIEPSIANGLQSRSQIMTDKVVALRRNRVRRTLGSLKHGEIEVLDRALLIVLGLVR